MADRVVSVKLKADLTDFTSSLARAAAETRGMAGDVEKTVDRDLPPVLRRSGDRSGGILSEGIAAGLIRNSPLIAAAAGGALAAGAPLAIAGATALFAGIGAVAASQSAEVRLAWSNVWADIQRAAIDDSASLVPVFTQMTARIGDSFQQMRPLLRDAFEAVGPQIDTFTNSLLRAAENALPGLVSAVQSGMPVIQGLGHFLESVGSGVSDLFSKISEHAPAAGQAFASIGDIVEALLPALGDLIGQGAELASVVLPPLASALGVVSDVLGVIAPILPAVAIGFASFKAAQAASGFLQTFAVQAQYATTAATGSVGAGERMGGAFSKVADGVGKAAGALPFLGIVISGAMGSMSDATTQEEKWAQAILAGGDAAVSAYNQYKSGTHWGQSIDEATGLASSWDDAKTKARDLWNEMTPLEQAQSKVSQWTATVTQRMNEQGPAAEGTRIAQERLAYWSQQAGQAQYDLANGMAAATGDALTVTPAIALVGDATGKTKAQMDEAVTSVQAWRGELQTVATSFVDPLNTYKTMLADKTASERAAAEATAASTASSTDSWRNYVGNASVSLREWGENLQKQITDQETWRQNIVTITQRGGLEVGQAFAAMGKEGATQTAQMANATDADFKYMAGVMAQDTRAGTAGVTAEMDTGMRIAAVVAASGGQATADAISQKLQIGVDEVARIAQQYGISLAGGVNPVLSALGKATIQYNTANAREGFSGRRYAEGGFTGPGGKYTPAGIVHAGEYVLTKEQTSRLGVDRIEAFANNGYAQGGLVALGHRLQGMGARVAEHPAFPPLDMHGHGKSSLHYTGHAIDVNTRPGTSALEQRELAPMAALARSLGFRTIFMAPGHFNHLHVDDGGGGSMGSTGAMMTVELPKPPSTAPYGMPISTGADAAMQKIYDDATAWVAANTIAPESAGGAADSGNTAGYRALGRTIAASMGVGGQFGSIDSVFTRESGWNPKAQNPTSTAYGIPQFLNATWAAYGGKTSDPARQIRAGIQYMKDRYGSPDGANAFWNKHHWYDDGGLLPPGMSLAYNGTGANEQKAVFTNEQWGAIQGWASREVSGGSRSGGGGSGPTNVTVQARVFIGDREITDIVRVEATSVVDNKLGAISDAYHYATGV